MSLSKDPNGVSPSPEYGKMSSLRNVVLFSYLECPNNGGLHEWCSATVSYLEFWTIVYRLLVGKPEGKRPL
jgi:hypothetical protein